MKKKLAIALCIVFAFALFGATAAYAAPGGNGNQGGNIENRIDKAQERLAFLEDIKPLIQTVVHNRAEIKLLKADLKEQLQLSRAHIAALKADIANVTDEQLALMTRLTTQLKECRTALGATNAQMVQLRQQLRSGRVNRAYEAVKAAYGSVIELQEQRMNTLRQMIQLCGQICQI